MSVVSTYPRLKLPNSKGKVAPKQVTFNQIVPQAPDRDIDIDIYHIYITEANVNSPFEKDPLPIQYRSCKYIMISEM